MAESSSGLGAKVLAYLLHRVGSPVRPAKSGDVLRLRNRMLATPVLWYRHAGTGRTLILVLNSHVGTAGYFAAIRDRIGELEARGFAVRWEGIRPAPDAAWASATGAERAAREVMTGLYRDTPRMAARQLGWVFQGDALVPGAGWVNTDLTDLEVVRSAGPDAILALGRAVAAAQAKAGAHREAFAAANIALVQRALARPHARLSGAITAFAPDVYRVLLAERSELAAAAADPGRDTVMLWGAEHADSIGAGLAAAGWSPTGRRRWLTAGRLPPLYRSLAGIAVVAWRVGADTWRAAQAGEAPPVVPVRPELQMPIMYLM